MPRESVPVDNAKRISRQHIITLIFAVPILVFSGLGFAAKFMEFINTFQGETEGVFAITPMVNYLLASGGFFCLLVWATLNGMFHDIEKPKQTMLKNDVSLDRRETPVATHAEPLTTKRPIRV